MLYLLTSCPLTLDHDAILSILDDVKIPEQSGADLGPDELLTAIGVGLATGCARIAKAGPNSKVIILLTDGRNTVESPITPQLASATAERLNIRVYTIGIGIPMGVTANMKLRQDDTVGSHPPSLDEQLLRDIAERTGGKYFNVTDQESMTSALSAIDEMETTSVETKVVEEHKDLLRWFLLPALAMIFLTAGLNSWITGSVIW